MPAQHEIYTAVIFVQQGVEANWRLNQGLKLGPLSQIFAAAISAAQPVAVMVAM